MVGDGTAHTTERTGLVGRVEITSARGRGKGQYVARI